MRRPIAVVLIGEDSLEANVGHLAALTGGNIFVAGADPLDLAGSIAAAFSAFRCLPERSARIKGRLRQVKGGRGNAIIHARWLPRNEEVNQTLFSRGVAALAASLALPALNEKAATELAQTEGLVTHLTSLVLVGEAGEVQDGLPATRKIPVPTPQDRILGAPDAALSRALRFRSRSRALHFFFQDDADTFFQDDADNLPDRVVHSQRVRKPARSVEAHVGPLCAPVGIAALALGSDWAVRPNQLIAGDLSGIDLDFAKIIKRHAELPDVISMARELGIDAVALVIALVARSCGSRIRAAARVARAILGANRATAKIDMLGAQLGLSVPRRGLTARC